MFVGLQPNGDFTLYTYIDERLFFSGHFGSAAVKRVSKKVCNARRRRRHQVSQYYISGREMTRSQVGGEGGSEALCRYDLLA